MKVSQIISHVEYREPTGTKDCKSGWTMGQVGSRLAAKDIVERGWAGPGKDNEISDSPVLREVDHQGLRTQLNDGKATKPGIVKAEMELIG